MKRVYSWKEGEVDQTKNHFELRYGKITQGGDDDLSIVAYVGPERDGVFPVSFLPSVTPENKAEIEREITYYLKHGSGWPEMGGPWGYLKHHVGTSANLYGLVHWSYVESE